MNRFLCILTGIFLLMPTLTAQEKAQAFTHAHLIPVSGPEIENGLLVIENGKITYAGPMKERKIPKNAETHDMKGKVIMPGMVDTHSHIGGPAGADRSGPIQPETRVMDSINVRSAAFNKARAGGITTANIMPGSGHLMSGQTMYLKLRDGGVISDLFIYEEDGSIAGGMKMANGTNSRRKAPFPGTRAKSASLVREQFIKAQEYKAKMEAATDNPEKKPPRDLGMEALVDLLDRKKVIHFHTHRHDDILTVIRIAREFNLDVVLHHVSEAWKVADEIVAAEMPCSIIVLDSPGGKIEARDLSNENGLVLEKAGALVAFHTDDPITDSRLFLRSAAMAVRYGMSREKALEGLTLAAAKMLRLEKRIGSLEEGKDADFVVLSADPFSVYAQIQETWIDGKLSFNRKDPKDRLYAVGGYGASHDQGRAHVHDLEKEEGDQ